jgi:hypothetical protein
MIFEICRTSNSYGFDHKKPPITGCSIGIKDIVEARSYSSFEQYEKIWGHSFYSRGTDHKVLPEGGISRVIRQDNVWLIEINTLEELIALSTLEDDHLVITKNTIEIYDTDRE